MTEACFCAVTKAGAPAGCACIEIVDGPYGPRFVETPSVRGDGRAIDAAMARADARRAASKDGPPPGSITKDTRTVFENGVLFRR